MLHRRWRLLCTPAVSSQGLVRSSPPPNKVSRCKMRVLRYRVQVPGARGHSRRQRGRRPYPTLSTAAGGWPTAPAKPPAGKAARSTTSILRPTTLAQRARSCILWHLRSPVADAERPVPMLTPLQRRFPLPFSASVISSPVVPTQALSLWGLLPSCGASP